MKIGIITKPNEKGQVVVPKKLRDLLGINENTLLNLVVRGKGIYLYPISEVIGKVESENSYYKVLEKTRGKWSENWSVLRDERRDVELTASKRRKKTW